MPRGVKKNLDAVAKRSTSGRESKSLAEQRIKGDAPAIGLVLANRPAIPKAKKPALKKTNSKGEVVKRKKGAPYYSLIKRCLKQDHSRKGTTRQALAKYIEANRGDCQVTALKRAIAKAVADGKIVQKGVGRYSLSKKEKKSKKKRTAKKSGEKKEEKEKKEKKSSKKLKKDKKEKKEKAPKKKKAEETKKSKAAPKKLVSKAPKVASTRGVPKAKAVTATASASSDTAATDVASGENVWVWQYYDGGFHNYDAAASDIVEGVYQEYLSSPYTCDVRAVKSGQWQYEIDFRVMTQTNIQHEDHTKRRIRRIQIPANEKGIKKNYGGDEMYTHVPEKGKK